MIHEKHLALESNKMEGRTIHSIYDKSIIV